MWHVVCHPPCRQPPQPHKHPDVPELGVSGHQHSPLLGVQVAAADSDGEEAGGAGRGAVAVQEAPDVEAEVSGAGQVVGVGADPADDLGRERGRRDGHQRGRRGGTGDSTGAAALTSQRTMPKEKMSTFSS